jgi:zinc protease
MLSDMAAYNLPPDYVKNEETMIREMTQARHKELADKYIVPGRMFYVVAGDAATQVKPLEKIGFGKVEIVR